MGWRHSWTPAPTGRAWSWSTFAAICACWPGCASAPGGAAERNEQLLRLADALAGLPEPQRRAVLLRYYEGRSLPEIGRRLRRSRAGVASLLRRGLARLRELMGIGGEP